MTDTIAPQEGKFYRTRGGDKATVTDIYPGGDYPVKGEVAGDGREWNLSGSYFNLGHRHRLDLIAEWTDEPTEGPVVTETVKRIKPGTYGRVRARLSGRAALKAAEKPNG